MLSRRRFMQALAVAAATPSAGGARAGSARDAGFGQLRPDPGQILDLPAGFSYTVISRAGEEMDDGLLVPGLHDGMAAFSAPEGTIRLVCNHEVSPTRQHFSAFGKDQERLPLVDRDKVYDYGNGVTPGAGGTTTIHYDPMKKERLRIHLSLAGTEINCAGGPMPWGSWLTCEETFSDPGTDLEFGKVVHREKRHGYVFEVPVNQRGLVEPIPLEAMGRFEHEAAAANPATGVVYMTEDRHRSLLYRFIPEKPGELRKGGKLQALAVRDKPGFDTRNWGPEKLESGKWLETTWIDLENADSEINDLRFRGYEQGAAIFARGEGLCFANGEFDFSCTTGGRQRLGQIFTYRPSPAEATVAEEAQPGRLCLIAESTTDSILRSADNLTMSPWGDLIVCEDTADHCGLVGLRPDGQQYALADNAYSSAELAGICFSPDGAVMFVNIQQRSLTLAITGPWSAATT